MQFNLDWNKIDRLIDIAIEEDIGSIDITSNILIQKNINIYSNIITNENCICCGIPIIDRILKRISPDIVCTYFAEDGDSIIANSRIINLNGNANIILSIERILLNFLQRLSGIATEANKYVELLKETNIKLLDTRKTIPGYRNLEKYAVYTGGGTNHRMGLYDGIIVKDNHLSCLFKIHNTDNYDIIYKEIDETIKKHSSKIIVEIETIEQFKQILRFNEIKRVILDNMTCNDIKEVINMNNRNMILEVSGGINLNNIKEISKFDIDFISVGAITHSARFIDMSLNIV